MTLTGRTALLALLLVPVAAVRPERSTLLVLAALVIALIALDIALAGSVRALRLRRRGADAVRLGESAVVELRVENTGRRRARGRLRDAWVPSAGAAPHDQSLDLRPGTATVLATTLTPTRRGDRPADRVTVRLLGPLGLAGRQGAHDVPWTVRALPAFASRRHLPGRLAMLREIDGRTEVLVRGQGTEFDSLREYVAGDDVRSIDWRATARAADVMVRTWRPERDRRVVVVLDTGRTSAGRVGDAPRLDAAMDAALLLAALAQRAGDRIELLAFDRTVRAQVRGAEGADLLPRMVDALAGVEPQLLETDADALVRTLLADHRQRSLVVLLTTLDSAPLRDGLLPVLPALADRHLVVLASVSDPRLGALAAGRGDVDAVYAAASAAKALDERRRSVALLGRLGIDVVDAPPETIAPALADRYLALKAAGRL